MAKRAYLNQGAGEEPSAPILSETDLGIALNYYRLKDHYEFQWVLEVCEGFGIDKESIRARKAFVSKTTIALCRLWSLNLLPYAEWNTRLGDALRAAIAVKIAEPPQALEKPIRKESIVDRYIADIENIVDLLGYAVVPINIELDLTRLSNANKESLRDFYRPKLEEIRAVLRGDDPELVQAYSSSTANLQRIGEFYASLIGTPLHVVTNGGNIVSGGESGVIKVKTKRTFKQRKPRVPKFNKLRFSVENSELGLKSVEPIKVHLSTTLVTYNAKYGSVSVYHAEQGKTLTFKRTSLINFDESKSFTKRAARSPTLIPVLQRGNKNTIIKAIDDVKSKPTPATSIMNEHTVLVAAF